MPKIQRHNICVPESILTSDGEVQTILLDERYTPYTSQKPKIENLCGSFCEYTSTNGLEGVVKLTQTCLGRQKEIFHLHGNVTIYQGKAAFMAVRGIEGLQKLSNALNLSSAHNIVHMAVLSGRIGTRVQVAESGLLESNLSQHNEWIRIEGRMYEHTNTVRLRVRKFEGPVFFLPEETRPDNNDWMVTGKGMVIIRLTWRRLSWTREAEDACLTMCTRAVEWLKGHAGRGTSET
jgi:hypothetical protein